jgi:hypothetical protein
MPNARINKPARVSRIKVLYARLPNEQGGIIIGNKRRRTNGIAREG